MNHKCKFNRIYLETLKTRKSHAKSQSSHKQRKRMYRQTHTGHTRVLMYAQAHEILRTKCASNELQTIYFVAFVQCDLLTL